MSPFQNFVSPRFTSYEGAESLLDSGTPAETPSESSPEISMDELTRLFNSAIVSTRAETGRDFSAELYQLVQTPAFSAILSAIRLLSRSHGLSEAAAAEQVITTFRKLDTVW